MRNETITPAQCRAARALVRLSRERVAEAAGLAPRTVIDFERGARNPHPNNLRAIRRALEAAGAEFLPGDGVRPRKTGAAG